MTDFVKEFSDYDDSLEKSKDILSGLLGLAIDGQRRVNHETRNGFVYVRLRDNLSEVVQAFNDKVSPVYDFPVIIQRKNNIWVVLGRDTDRYANWGTSAPFLPQHGDQHSFNRDGAGGGDVVWVYPDQFEPLLVYPSGTFGANNVIVAPYMLQRSADFIWVGNTGTVNLVSYKPSNNQAIMGLVYLDTVSGNPGFLLNSGTPFSASLTGSSQIYPYIPYPSSTQEPLYAVRLVSGTSTIQWANLYNTRQFVGGFSSSTGSSFSTGTSLPSFITGSIPFALSDGTLTEDGRLHWENNNGQLWLNGQPPPFFNANQLPLTIRATGSNASTGFSIITAGTGTLGSPSGILNSYRARGDFLLPTPVQTGDRLMSIVGGGFDGVTWQNSTRIAAYANGDFITGTYAPSRLDFEVVPSGSVTRSVIAELRGDGFNLKNTGTYNVNGVPHTHSDSGMTLQQAWAWIG